jgi:hypothetical protein
MAVIMVDDPIIESARPRVPTDDHWHHIVGFRTTFLVSRCKERGVNVLGKSYFLRLGTNHKQEYRN